MAWRKTFLDNNISSLQVHAIHKDALGVATLGMVGNNPIGKITGSDKAADAAREGAALSAGAITASKKENIGFQKWLWGEQKQLTQPFVEAGGRALGSYEEAISQPFTAADMEIDPGYQFRLSEGIKGIENSAAARGMQLSGRTLKGIGRYAQDYASGEFQNAYARRQQGISNLYNLATMGQASASGQAIQGGVMGGNISQSIAQGGQSQAQLYSDLGSINSAQAMAPWNSFMQIGGMAAQYYGAKAGAG